MKIICKNCYHKWEGKFGETDLFFCHKCGYNINTKKIDLDKLKNWIKNNQKIVGENIKKIIKQNENLFPISSLVKQAKKFDNFKDFSRFYDLEIYHGYYWHITNNKDFKISNQTGPRDMSSLSSGGVSEKGAIMLTSHLELWDEYYNIDRDTEQRVNKRPYAVLFDPSDIEPKYLRQVGRGFGNEVYLHASEARKLKQLGVYTIEDALKLDEQFHNMIPQSEKALKKIYNYAHQIQENTLCLKTLIKETVSDLFDERKSEVENFRNELSKRLGIIIELYFVNPETGPALKLPLIKVPKELQRQGLGTKAMEEIIKYADEKGYRIFLTPSTDWGSSKSGLLRFYKSFGFVPHSGRNRDYHFKDDMVRLPKLNEGNTGLSLYKNLNQFFNELEIYQSNHMGNYNRGGLVTAFLQLPEEVKKALLPRTTNGLFRGTDGLTEKPALSFSNHNTASIFGTYVIPFSMLQSYLGLISTAKAYRINEKYKLGFEIGDDEGEVIVLNPVWKKNINLEKYRI